MYHQKYAGRILFFARGTIIIPQGYDHTSHIYAAAGNSRAAADADAAALPLPLPLPMPLPLPIAAAAAAADADAGRRSGNAIALSYPRAR